MEMNGHWGETPNKLEPHFPQKPRLVCFEDWNHFKAPFLVMSRCSFFAEVTTKNVV